MTHLHQAPNPDNSLSLLSLRKLNLDQYSVSMKTRNERERSSKKMKMLAIHPLSLSKKILREGKW